MNICKSTDCTKIAKCRGMCISHYDKARKSGLFKTKNYTKCKGNICNHSGCSNPAKTNGYCSKHYQRFLKRGTTEKSERGIINDMTVKERLDYCSTINEVTGCWNWKKQISPDGYGVISINNYPVRAHRASYSEFIGEIPKGLHVLHRCDNRKCINPDHLFLGTNQDNLDDMIQKGRSCKGEDKPNSKLTENQVKEIKIRFSNGETPNEIFNDYPVSGKCLRNIRDGITWKHVTI